MPVPWLPPFLRYFPAQFDFLKTLRMGVVEVVRRLLDPGGSLSYARAGEDVALERIFCGARGTYVDVGCNHADRSSCAYRLYKAGWRGLTIDAMSALVESHRRLRIRDIQIESAISDQAGTAEIRTYSDDQITTLDRSRAEALRDRPDGHVRRVEARVLTEVLDGLSWPFAFDLLKVDVEGHDLAVLSGLDFERYRPRLILVEMLGVGRNLDRLDELPLHRFLCDRGYSLVGYLVQNGFYADTRSPRFGELYLG